MLTERPRTLDVSVITEKANKLVVVVITERPSTRAVSVITEKANRLLLVCRLALLLRQSLLARRSRNQWRSRAGSALLIYRLPPLPQTSCCLEAQICGG